MIYITASYESIINDILIFEKNFHSVPWAVGLQREKQLQGGTSFLAIDKKVLVGLPVPFC